MQNYLPTSKSEMIELFFVRSEVAKAEHTWWYVSISISEDSCKKNSSERFLFVFNYLHH